MAQALMSHKDAMVNGSCGGAIVIFRGRWEQEMIRTYAVYLLRPDGHSLKEATATAPISFMT
jgi:hypothetical protein